MGGYKSGDVLGCGLSTTASIKPLIYFTVNGEFLFSYHGLEKNNIYVPSMTLGRTEYKYYDDPMVMKLLDKSEFMFKQEPGFGIKPLRTNVIKEEMCVICMSCEPDVLLLPCHHQVCCADCLSDENVTNISG